MVHLRFTFTALIICLLSCKESSKSKATETQAKTIVKVNARATADTTKDNWLIMRYFKDCIVCVFLRESKSDRKRKFSNT